ncbi:MAG: hypothetical protein KDE53_20820, partial [Caldilineaceae bacterium]|nr:hypothetical protein [Caldilineaceae bacterium]
IIKKKTDRLFEGRRLAVTLDNQRLYVARFLSFTGTDGVQGDDFGKEGVICQLAIPADVNQLPTVAEAIIVGPQNTGFAIDANGDGVNDPTSAFPNQIQSLVIRSNQLYLPNIAASPSRPLKFNVDTQAFVNVIDNAVTGTPVDASADKFLNLHLGARDPEAGKTRLFFANPWAMAFTTQSGAGDAYVVSAGSDLLVKVNVDASGVLTFTEDANTTRYIDLNDPDNSATAGDNAGKNPLGIVIHSGKAFVMNLISRNVSVVDLTTDSVEKVIRTAPLPPAGSFDEQLLVGKEMFFSSRGLFEAPTGQTATVSLENRLSSEGWQNCGSCHFAGLTDGVIWQFVPGPRKSIPMNSTWSPHNPFDQRLLNYSAFFDEVQDFEINVRNISGPGNLPAPVNGSSLDFNHGLIISDTGNINFAPQVVNAFTLPNANRQQVLVRLPGSNTTWPALDALKEWIRFGIRTPEGALTANQLGAGNSAGALPDNDVRAGRRLFFRAECHTCHGGTKWSVSHKDFVSPPAAEEIATETGAAGVFPGQFLARFLSNIGSFNLGVAGQGNDIGENVGAPEVNTGGQLALGTDHNGDGKGEGFNIPSLLAIWQLPPYYHNGACETLDCVLSNETHRAAGKGRDILSNPADQAKVVAWLKTLDADTPFPLNVYIDRHDLFVDPPKPLKGTQVTLGANVSLFGVKSDLADLISDLGLSGITVHFAVEIGSVNPAEVTLTADKFGQDFGQAIATTTWTIPGETNILRPRITVTIDPADELPEDNEVDNEASRRVRVRTPGRDRTPPTVNSVLLSDDDPFNDTDRFTDSGTLRVKLQAEDPAGGNGEEVSGLDAYCIVGYKYDTVRRRWVEQKCQFEPLPTPTAPNTFIVEESFDEYAGVIYALAWVRDRAGNISKKAVFDVISFIPNGAITLNRNDIRIFRIPLASGNLTLDFDVDFGDIDVAVFDDFRNPAAPRCALSANNGTVAERIVLPGTCTSGFYQVEVRAAVNSRFTVSVAEGVSAASVNAPQVPKALFEVLETPTIAGPPALQTAIDDETELYIPVVLR